MVSLMVLNKRLIYLSFSDWSEMATVAERVDSFLINQNKLKICNENYIIHGTGKDDFKIGRFVTGFENFLPDGFNILDLGPAKIEEFKKNYENFQSWEDIMTKFSQSAKDYFEIHFSDPSSLVIRFCSDAK